MHKYRVVRTLRQMAWSTWTCTALGQKCIFLVVYTVADVVVHKNFVLILSIMNCLQNVGCKSVSQEFMLCFVNFMTDILSRLRQYVSVI